MECIVHTPSSALAPYIKSYWYLQDGTPATVNGGHTERVIPNGHISLMFHFGEPFNMDATGGRQPRCFISGISTSYNDVQVTGATDMGCIVFRPHGLYPFLPYPVDEIGSFLSAPDASIRWINELFGRLADTTDCLARTEIIERTLLSVLSSSHTTSSDPRIAHTVGMIIGGTYDVRKLADGACLGERQFSRVFTAATGLAPKKLTRIVRFQRSLNLMRLAPSSSLTAIAYDSGYNDQSHFNNDFKLFTGFTPGRYRAEFEPYSDFFS